jgi:lipopolysaccharide export system permease protein
MIKIWPRYFLKETIKSFFLFILTFYGLYVLIDYSSHASNFHYHHFYFQVYEIALYYVCEFAPRMEVFIPFGLLLATIRTLTNLNIHNELVALMASGIPLRTLIRPFIFLGMAMVLLIYINTQFWIPLALQKIKQIEQTHRIHKHKGLLQLAVKNLNLKDNSHIIFHDYNSNEKKLVDAYWIRDINDIYRIKYLYPYSQPPVGHFIDHFKRRPTGELVIIESFDLLSFPEMRFHRRDLFQGITNPEDESLSELWKKLPPSFNIQSQKESQRASVFYHKMIIPWLCLLAVIGIAPFCVRYSRTLSPFFIYTLGIFGLVAIYLLLNATLVLGKRQVVEPWLATLFPFFICSSLASYKYLKL